MQIARHVISSALMQGQGRAKQLLLFNHRLHVTVLLAHPIHISDMPAAMHHWILYWYLYNRYNWIIGSVDII